MTEIEETNPLWMPKGSVRSIVVFALLGMTGYMLIKGIPIPEWLITLVSGAIMFYFGVRKNG